MELHTPEHNRSINGIAAGSQGLLIATLLENTGKPVIHVSASDRELEQLRTSLAFFVPGTEVLVLPAWDCLPYDRVSPNNAIIAERINTLVRLSALRENSETPIILLTTARAVIQRLPPQKFIASASFTLRPHTSIDREALSHFLTTNGYRRVGKVMEPGEYAIRGSIIDLFPPGAQQAQRIDMFGDDIEHIKAFDPLTQRSGEATEVIRLHPVNEAVLTEASMARFRDGYRNLFGAARKGDLLYESVSEGRSCPGIEHWLPLFYETLDTIFDYLPSAVTVLDHQLDIAIADFHENIRDYYTARKESPVIRDAAIYNPLPPEKLYIMEERWKKALSQPSHVFCSPFDNGETANQEGLTQIEKGGINMGFRPGRSFAAERKQGDNIFEVLKQYLNYRMEEKKQCVIACNSTGSMQRLEQKLQEQSMACQQITTWKEVQHTATGTINFAVLPLERGFETENSIILSEQDILGDRILRNVKRKKRPEQFMAEVANFNEGEFVVHREHGIGRFEGLETVGVDGVLHDCLKLLYEGDDRLFLPVENIDLITRYGGENIDGVKLDKLGGANWQARKSKLKKHIKMAADELLKVAADRQLHQAPSLTPSPGLYEEFCSRFPFMETEDQERAIADIMEDLASGAPTDRLICGDVGFGKTEVAMRAAFIAATAEGGKVQVAIITPTTLLARQHYANFTERFSGMPVRIRQLSRLTSAKENKQTLEEISSSTVDIVIGTHALLGKGVKFKNLGLLVVDEEQHFGVKQKEALKQLRHNIHVLTLSATPIPRTLQMALSGIRELSLIATPPIDRLAVRTFITPYDPVVVREAILREYHRGGQVFYVTPRVKDITDLKRNITELVPEIKIAVAHGQIPPGALDEVMNAFYDGKYQLLLSTTIIESGLDVPSANTMIINRPDMFGLSQLYQLRGRVGRGKQRAYAYLTLKHNHTLSKNALKRLEVMQTLDTLGAGFSVASHDMDIRGFGNLLGEEQSGHVREVGTELYQKMLEDAVKEAKKQSDKSTRNDEEDEHWSPQINLGLSVLIPEDYVKDLELRLGLYRRSASFKTNEEIEDFAAELIDRFGQLPDEVEHLLEILKIKLLCIKAGIERLDAGPKGIVIAFRKNHFSRPEALINYISGRAGAAKLRADHRLVISRSTGGQGVLKEAHNEAEALANIAA